MLKNKLIGFLFLLAFQGVEAVLYQSRNDMTDEISAVQVISHAALLDCKASYCKYKELSDRCRLTEVFDLDFAAAEFDLRQKKQRLKKVSLEFRAVELSLWLHNQSNGMLYK